MRKAFTSPARSLGHYDFHEFFVVVFPSDPIFREWILAIFRSFQYSGQDPALDSVFPIYGHFEYAGFLFVRPASP